MPVRDTSQPDHLWGSDRGSHTNIWLWCTFVPSPKIVSLFVKMPFTKYDLYAITGDSEQLNKFMETYGIRRPRPESCPSCQGRMSSKPTRHRVVLKYRCVMEGCQKWMSPETDGILEKATFPRRIS